MKRKYQRIGISVLLASSLLLTACQGQGETKEKTDGDGKEKQASMETAKLADSIRQKYEENYVYARHFIERELPEAVVSELQGTYLMWIDLKPYLQDKDVVQTLQEKCHLAIDYGDWFGGEDWKYYIRVNLATKTENIAQAMENLKRGLE